MSAACPACASAVAEVFAAAPRDREYFAVRAQPARILRCATCRSLYQDPWPTADELQPLYGADYQNYTSTRVPLLAALDAAYQRAGATAFVRRHGRDAAVLDFGCGQGGFLRALAEAGCGRLTGFDFVIYPELAASSPARLFDSLSAIRDAGLRFDVIRMRHVIEHLTTLDETMTALGALLAPGGRIVGQTPNAAHYTAALTGGYWGPLHYPYHTILFSPAGLAAAARRWRLQAGPTAGALLPTGWAMSAENLLKQLTGSRRRGRTALYTVLMAASMPMAVLDRLLSPAATANFDFQLAGA